MKKAIVVILFVLFLFVSAYAEKINCQAVCRKLADLCFVSYSLGYNYGYNACVEILDMEIDKEIKKVSFHWCQIGYQDSIKPPNRRIRMDVMWEDLYTTCLKRCNAGY